MQPLQSDALLETKNKATRRAAKNFLSQNKKKKLLWKTTESCLAVKSHSNSGADILDVADRLERAKLEDGVSSLK